jgi:hypothetical protein
MQTIRSLSKVGAKITGNLFPTPLTWEERKMIFHCPHFVCSVSMYSCWQCSSFELHNKLVHEITKKSGHCGYPKTATEESRKVTAEFYKAVNGNYPDFLPSEDFQEILQIPKVKKVRGEESKQRLALVVSILTEVNTKEQYEEEMKKAFPEMSAVYISALFYQVKKTLPLDMQNKFVAKKKGKGGEGMIIKLQKAKELYKKLVDKIQDKELIKQTFLQDYKTMYPLLSDSYAMTLFYSARRDSVGGK